MIERIAAALPTVAGGGIDNNQIVGSLHHPAVDRQRNRLNNVVRLRYRERLWIERRRLQGHLALRHFENQAIACLVSLHHTLRAHCAG